MIKVSAPCKIHLLGEHSAVHGKPAILASVDKRCYVTITPRGDKNIVIKSKGIDEILTITPEDVLKQTKQARKSLDEFKKTNDIPLLKSITKNSLDYIVIAVGETLDFYNKSLSSGFEIEIDSKVPVGAGLGSSGVIAITVAAAVGLFIGQKFDKDVIYRIAYSIEQKKHGIISGGDFSAPCFGGLVWFRKETDDLRIIKHLDFSLPKKLADNFVVIDSGKPEESTGEMVGLFRQLLKDHPEEGKRFLDNQEKLTRDLLIVIKTGEEKEFARIITAGERNLENIGVVSNFAKSIIKEIERVGGVAKICGGGGKTKGSGMLLAYHPNKKVIERIAKNNNLPYFTTELGVEGLRQEE